MRQTLEERLLALHYVLPVPYHRVQKLLQYDPKLEYLERMSIPQLEQLLKIPYERAKRFQQSFINIQSTSLLSAYEKHRIIPISIFHVNYPETLKRLFDPPLFLYAKGNISYLTQKMKIAIIGSRKATSYSQEAMQFIIPPLVNENAVIVSGMAKGADSMAHKITHNLGGQTIAVVGHGHFHCYPSENESFYKMLQKYHLVVTEYPPYVPPRKWTFPMRNRIISGLSEAVIVTEANEKSGTVSTLQHALDNGKEVFCVPGSIMSPLSLGPHKLLSEGAKPVWSGYQVIEELRNFIEEK